MINNEHKYRTELFELLKEDLSNISDDQNISALLNEIFMSDNIDNEGLIKKLIN